MDIRTKLVFALVAVALVSMASLGVFTVLRVEARFEQQTDEQLNGLAVLKQEALERQVKVAEQQLPHQSTFATPWNVSTALTT